MAEEIVFKRAGNVTLNMSVYKPSGWKRDDSRIGIVFFAGGGWQRQNRTQFEQQCGYLAGRGLVALTADYRTKQINEATITDGIGDAKSAVRWIRFKSGELGINPKRIAAAGGSAGGHMAACTAILQEFDEPGENLSVSSSPNTLVLFNPALDLLDPAFSEKVRDKPELVELGDRITSASPYHHLRRGIPPTIIFHGTDDKIIPISQIFAFAEKMKELGNLCTVVPAKGEGHGFFNYGGRWYRACIEKAYEFIVSTVGVGGVSC